MKHISEHPVSLTADEWGFIVRALLTVSRTLGKDSNISYRNDAERADELVIKLRTRLADVIEFRMT